MNPFQLAATPLLSRFSTNTVVVTAPVIPFHTYSRSRLGASGLQQRCSALGLAPTSRETLATGHTNSASEYNYPCHPFSCSLRVDRCTPCKCLAWVADGLDRHLMRQLGQRTIGCTLGHQLEPLGWKGEVLQSVHGVLRLRRWSRQRFAPATEQERVDLR